MNFVDYCRWRGDLSFKKDPFNEIDNMCFAQIAYCELDGIIQGKEKKTLKEVCDIFFSLNDEEEMKKSKSFSKMSPFLMREMANTKRFGSCLTIIPISFCPTVPNSLRLSCLICLMKVRS